MNDPVLSIKSLLETYWDEDNTSDIVPQVSTGWYDQTAKRPMITLTDPVDTPVSRGPTKFFGIVASGSPTQYMLSTLALNVWVSRSTVAINPKQARREFVEEIHRILLAHYGAVTDLDFIAWGGGRGFVDTTTNPPVFRYSGEVGYGYHKTS